MTYDSTEQLFDDDPVLGKFLVNYPADRLRLLIQGGAALLVVYFVTTVALWQADAGYAAAVTVLVIAAATLLVGWYVTHLWNREIVIFEKGFYYREGSNIAPILYADVSSILQRGERRSYFGGLIRRNMLIFTMRTEREELIILNRLYRRLDELTLRLEKTIVEARLPIINQQLENGERIAFGDGLKLSAIGLHEGGRDLTWENFGGYRIQSGRINIYAQTGDVWYSAPLSDVDNIRMLIDLLQERHTQVVESDAS
jgi:hypothetical protein